ncbi:Golgi SNAP receptor complex member 1-like [Pollicipes pollicipes]|uniref:Golgi SNAP receptor complex member 1-like n=1 Tax=Pollicipes pollicipes TaxID=41117 RepID=UPI001884AA77|nr:Golgi SNAP receptor complex member 1-like [Pollicipes pollicipes]
MASAGHNWEDLRKQARQVENELDVKLVAYSKLGAGYGNVTASIPSDQQPLLGDEQAVEKTEAEIEACLAKLSTVNELMSEFSTGPTPSAAVVHTLQRHRDILQDYSHEFGRTKAALDASRDRQQLLASSRGDDGAYKNGRLNRRLDHLLKENEHIRNSDRLIDEQIAIAMETREHLSGQRATFKAIQTRVNDLAHRFPMINSLLQRVQLRKRRDSLVLGLVIGLCLVFFVWYLFG